jgi:hypothetical protein
MMPLWSPPHPWQPTRTGTIVGLPPISVVNHVFAVHSVFVVASVENPGGTVFMVEDIEPIVVVVGTVGSVTDTDGNAIGTSVGRLSDPKVKAGKENGGGIITLEGGRGDFGTIITPLYPEAHKVRQGQIGNIVGVVWPGSSVVVCDQVVKLEIEIRLVLNTNWTVPAITVASPAVEVQIDMAEAVKNVSGAVEDVSEVLRDVPGVAKDVLVMVKGVDVVEVFVISGW